METCWLSNNLNSFSSVNGYYNQCVLGMYLLTSVYLVIITSLLLGWVLLISSFVFKKHRRNDYFVTKIQLKLPRLSLLHLQPLAVLTLQSQQDNGNRPYMCKGKSTFVWQLLLNYVNLWPPLLCYSFLLPTSPWGACAPSLPHPLTLAALSCHADSLGQRS